MRTLLRSVAPAMLAATTGLTYMTFLPAAQAGTPITLAATPGTQQSVPDVVLTWTGASATAQYLVYRDSHMLSAASGGAYTDTHVHGGETHRYFVAQLRPKLGTSNTITVSVPVPAPAPPSNLTAGGSWDATHSIATTHLAWGAVAGANTYNVYRDGSLLQAGTPGATLTAPATGFTDSAVASGHTYTYTVTAVGPGGESAKSAAASVTAPNPPTPPAPTAPTGLTATGVWDPICVECSNMAMPEVDLSWQASPGATGYKVYRNGALLQSGVSAAAFEDMTVASGQTYTYKVAATGPGGDSGQSSPASATAPNPPPPATATGTALIAPANLCDHPFYLGGANDTLTWDPVPSAVSYNVYQYDTLLARGVTGTSYNVTPAQSVGAVEYTVTAVDASGMESLPSAELTPSGAYSPGTIPSYNAWSPTAPDGLTAVPEWNNGAPRVALSWRHSGNYYRVYRDGVLLAAGLWGLAYYDSGVRPGESHVYSVSGTNIWTGAESAQCPPVTATALSAAPASQSGKLQILKVVSNTNSVKVFFNTIPGAVDYRVYDAARPGTIKYAGRNEAYQNYDMNKNAITPIPALTTLSIEMNGIDPVRGASLVLQAVDKLGPFQKMDGMAGPGAMNMAGMVDSAINGQGDPSNVPNVIAQSDPFPVTCVSHALTGAQAFFDDFQTPAPLTPVTALDPPLRAINDSGHPIQEQENDKWRIRTYDADNVMTRAFFMGGHFMDTLYDGPFGQHNNNSSLVMMPKATGDISGGRVLHVTFEVDAHMDGRRWCDLMVAGAGDTLLTATSPDKLGTNALPTASGNQFVWEVTQGQDTATLVEPTSPGATTTTQTDLVRKAWDDMSYQRDEYKQVWQGVPYANGSAAKLDNRSRFDLYLSQNHYRFVETEADGVTKIVCDKDFPAGLTLPFSNAQVYFVHELYHTGNDRPENVGGSYNDAYWYNYRPWSDERHWNNMGFEVLPSFPTLLSSAQ